MMMVSYHPPIYRSSISCKMCCSQAPGTSEAPKFLPIANQAKQNGRHQMSSCGTTTSHKVSSSSLASRIHPPPHTLIAPLSLFLSVFLSRYHYFALSVAIFFFSIFLLPFLGVYFRGALFSRCTILRPFDTAPSDSYTAQLSLPYLYTQTGQTHLQWIQARVLRFCSPHLREILPRHDWVCVPR